MAPRKNAKAVPHPEPEMFTIYADILQETEASEGHEGAILVNCGDAEKIWLPISQIQYVGERGDTDVPIEIPDWLADENGLVDGQGKRVDESTFVSAEEAARRGSGNGKPRPASAARNIQFHGRCGSSLRRKVRPAGDQRSGRHSLSGV